MAHHYLACDLGAESGRVMLGTIEGGKLQLEEIHRFPNQVQRVAHSLHWNIPGLFAELKVGLRKAADRNLQIESISTDSWGVDYVLLDEKGRIVEPVFHYRDPRTTEGVRRAHAKVSWEEIFAETGIQFMPINTLYQLASEDPERLGNASTLLSIADLFNYLLSGNSAVEASNASTFQLYNPKTGTWSRKLISKLQLPEHLFGRIVPPGIVLGTIQRSLSAETGLKPIKVIASCSHDTGAAVVGVPALQKNDNWAYLSSGTWSLMGVERDQPVINDKARELNFTNEIGYGKTIRLLKNIVGLWLVQECRRVWKEQGRELDYAQLTLQAEQAEPFRSLINPAAPEFISSGNMAGKIMTFCERTVQPVPTTPAQFIRCILESLALLYSHTFSQLESLLSHKIEKVHIVGGGSKNLLLNQFTADALGVEVLAGPVEATAAGNILIQAITLGHLKDVSEARTIIKNSTSFTMHYPINQNAWNEQKKRFQALLEESAH